MFQLQWLTSFSHNSSGLRSSWILLQKNSLPPASEWLNSAMTSARPPSGHKESKHDYKEINQAASGSLTTRLWFLGQHNQRLVAAVGKSCPKMKCWFPF